VHLVSQEGESIDLSMHAARLSELVNSLLNEEQDAEEAQEIAVDSVRSNALVKIAEFLVHHASEPLCAIPKPLPTSKLGDNVQEWYAKFMEVEQETVYELMLAASYMQIAPLVELTGAAIGSWLKDQSPEQIRRTFNIINDFTPDEEARLRSDRTNSAAPSTTASS
jgi:S-phase kinase-associated protein 1